MIATGEPAAAASSPAARSAVFESRGMGTDVMTALLTAGAALAAAGDTDGAIAELNRVSTSPTAAAASACATSRRSSCARSAFASRPVDPRRGRARQGLAELTDREREIADLVAEGRSNKAVAATLFLSEKTIEHHLSRVYAKLGVRSRVQLTAVLARS